ncbi:DNA replication protein [Mixta sp. Marseille-Q2659]|uniref:DNA replication protein n=1 Tax=Mixta sp. Marseille-Q2659 TaxID=2736607 RepID=UPI0023B9D1C6|nr:DNA replication protein [Mixta sp. Marseille-Q2659]
MSNVASLARAREARKNQETPHHGGKGYALLHRKIKELPFYRTDSEAVHLWVHIILSANHAPAPVNTEFGEILVNRGEFITGRNTLAAETGITGDRIKYLLNKFEKLSMISRITNRKFTRISVTKYDDYQPNFVPTECQQSANQNPQPVRLSGEVVPTECQQSATNNEVLNNNSISKDIECPSQAAEFDDDEPIRIAREPKQPDQPKRIITPYEEMVSAYHEILPEMAGVEVIRGKRKAAMRKFWNECNQEYQKAHGKPFTIANWRNYLEYIAVNCTWMMQERPNGKGGFWQAKNLDYLVTDECYTKVKEQRANDRK